MNNWHMQKSKGDTGQLLVKQYLQTRGHKVKDLSNNPEYWAKDIDFLVDDTFYMQLKTDYRCGKTGNLFLQHELEYFLGDTKEGWFHTSGANYLLYLDIRNGILYLYRLEKLREYVRTHKVISRCCRDANKIVYGYCVPIVELRKEGIQINHVKIKE